MTDLYLIAHKVYGQPAFDIAERMDCPLCAGHGHDLDGYCHECDSLGYWWIIPTSGHRAYPCYATSLNQLYMQPSSPIVTYTEHSQGFIIPSTLPDHYIAQEAKPVSLTDLLNLRAKPTEPTTPFPRRL